MARLFARFPAVLASEDNAALPFFLLARDLLEEGRIGRLRRVHLQHSGYRHHAIAAIKRLTGARSPRTISIERWNRWCSEIRLSFPGGVRAVIQEPRRYGSGRTMIIGSEGSSPITRSITRTRSSWLPRGSRAIPGLTVDGDTVAPTALDDALVAGLAEHPLDDPSLMNQMKIRGFMELLASAADGASGTRYPIEEAIADDLAIRFAERLPIRVPGNPRLLRSAARASARFMRRGGDEV